MRRIILIGLLSLGVIGGYGSAVYRAAHGGGASCEHRQE